MSNAYMRLLNQVINKHFPKIRKVEKAYSLLIRNDSNEDYIEAINDVFLEMHMELSDRLADFGLLQKISKISEQTRVYNVNNWIRLVKNTLGVDIFKDYYNGEFFKSTVDIWVAESISRIQSLPESTLNELQSLTVQSFKEGKGSDYIAEQLIERYNVAKSDANLIARDQLGKLNSRITKQQHEDAGVKDYTWDTCGDSRVRDSHKALNGKVFSWSNPPVVSEPGKPLRRCHPGEDYQCRCVALPIFRFENLTIAVA